jgi:hypothetical protein
MKKAIALFLVVVLMLATSSVALATGSSLHHDGNSRYSYYTSDYVAQKNDPYFDCDSCALGGTFDVVALCITADMAGKCLLVCSRIRRIGICA